MKGVVLRSSFQDHWLVYWFGISRRSRIARHHLTVCTPADSTAYTEADLLTLACGDVPHLDDGQEALKMFVDTYGTYDTRSLPSDDRSAVPLTQTSVPERNPDAREDEEEGYRRGMNQGNNRLTGKGK